MEISRVVKNFFNAPLEKIVSKHAKPIDKIISALAIATFSLFSLGVYGVHAYKFIEKHKVENLSIQLKQLIDTGKHEEVEILFKKHSMLKTASLGPVISETIEKEQWELLKVLVENGVNVDDHKTDNGTPLYKLLDSEEVDYSAALYLVQNGALLNLNLKEYDFSPLMLAILSLKKESPVEAEELIKSMVSKGASLAKDEAKKHIKDDVIPLLNEFNWSSEEDKSRFRQMAGI